MVFLFAESRSTLSLILFAATILLIHEEFAPAPDRLAGHGCSAGCLPGSIRRQAARVVSTSSRACVDRILPIQRTFPHCLGIGFGVRIQRAVAKHSPGGYGTA